MEVFEPSLEGLGRKHVAYGVRETHYETVGASLTEKLEAAWIAAYTLIAGTISCAAYQAQARTA